MAKISHKARIDLKLSVFMWLTNSCDLELYEVWDMENMDEAQSIFEQVVAVQRGLA